MIHLKYWRIDTFFLCLFFLSIFSEEYPPITEENALAKWASDPANTAWMESKIGNANAAPN